jgi:hypothetical protein
MMPKKRSAKLKQNPNKGFKEKPKLSKNQMILETMSIMNEEIHKLTGEMKTMMNLSASLLEVAEMQGLFTAQDVLMLMDNNVKNSSINKAMQFEINKMETKDIKEISKLLGNQLYEHNLGSSEIRKDIIVFEDFCKPDEIDGIITEAEKYRRDLASKQLQEDNEDNK